MATSPSPQLSPVMGGGQRVDRNHTNSPPLPLSKRDKRRTMLADRLEEITKSFSQNRDMHYREQLQAIQIDMNLIMEADPNSKEPLKDQPLDVDALVLENVKTIRKTLDPVIPPRAGRMYADFAKEINDAMEERDSNLTVHKRDFDVKMAELAASHAYRKKLASGEYVALSSTLRDRLINSVTSKKNRLSKDRETVEIGDSNALLLHPSQYGLANPASPGMHGKRATRHRRDADDLTNFPESNKRKRKAGDSDESPAPTRQRLDNGTSTPLWFAEKREMAATQFDSPLYSIDKLFTEKELSMYYNAAALAAHQHMLRHPPYSDALDSPPNGHSNSSLEDLAATIDPEADVDSPDAGGAVMERQFSHATRSTRNPNFNTGFGVDAISDLNYPGNMAALIKQTPKMPPLLASVMQKGYVKGDAANQPAGLSLDDAASDFEMIRQARMFNNQRGKGKNLEQDNGGKGLLEAVARPKRYDYWIRSEKGQYEESVLREDIGSGLGGEPMSRGPSDIGMGGTPMSRTATGDRVVSSRGRAIKSTPTTA